MKGLSAGPMLCEFIHIIGFFSGRPFMFFRLWFISTPGLLLLSDPYHQMY